MVSDAEKQAEVHRSVSDAEQVVHEVTAVPVEKLRDGIIAYRFECSCGREGNGWHRTPEKAIAAGHDHVHKEPVGE